MEEIAPRSVVDHDSNTSLQPRIANPMLDFLPSRTEDLDPEPRTLPSVLDALPLPRLRLGMLKEER